MPGHSLIVEYGQGYQVLEGHDNPPIRALNPYELTGTRDPDFDLWVHRAKQEAYRTTLLARTIAYFKCNLQNATHICTYK